MEHSMSETSCSSVLGLDNIIENDKVRYIRKGYGLIFAIIFAFAFFGLGPQVMASIWPYLDGYTAAQKHMFCMISISYIGYMVANSMMFFIYWLKHPFFEKYKIIDKPWPWEKDAPKFFEKCRQVFKNWFINALIGGVITIVDSPNVEVRTDSASLPNTWELIWQVSFCMFVEDFVFYWSHRTLHHPILYPYIHKQHHQFYHSSSQNYKTNIYFYFYLVSIAAEYAHPLEYVFSNILPTFVGVKLLGNRMHLATTSLWLIMRIMETIDGHCGYEFSWSPYRLLPFSGSSEYHNFHHSHNVGNYGSFFSYWDTFFGTNGDYFKFKVEKEKETKIQNLRNQYDNKIKEKEKCE